MQRRRRHPTRSARPVKLSWQEAATVILNHPELVARMPRSAAEYIWRPGCRCTLCARLWGALEEDHDPLQLSLVDFESGQELPPVGPLDVRLIPADGPEA